MAGAVCLGFALVPLVLNLLGSQMGTEKERIFKASTDQSRYVGSYDEGMNMLKTVDRRGVIVCNGDIDILPLWYLQHVEGRRTEVCSFTMQLIPYVWYRNLLFKQWPELAVPVSPSDPRPETVVQAMIDKHRVAPAEPGKPRDPAGDEPWKRSFYFTNIFTAPWMRERNPAIPDGFLWRMVATRGLDYPFTSARLNSLWAGYRLRYLDAPERGYWDEYTDVMKDSYGIGHDFTGYFALMNGMQDIALWSFQNALKYRQLQTLPRLYMMVGESHLALGNASAAITHFQESLDREGRNPYVLARMGEAFRAMGDLANAEAAYRASLSLNPQQKEALDGLRSIGKDVPNIVAPGQPSH
jgi:hypothetical protein